MTEPLLVGDKAARSDKMVGVKIRSPTIIFLQRARMVFMLTALIPTVFMTVIGIVILATGGSKSAAVVGGILVLAFCGTALAGYVLGTILVLRLGLVVRLRRRHLGVIGGTRRGRRDRDNDQHDGGQG